MKVVLIKACFDSYFKSYKKYQASPPQNIFSAAAALNSLVKIEMYDETCGMTAPRKLKCDLVMIYMSTPDALRGYELARHYMKQGLKVMMGGLHPTFMTQEALLHCNSVMQGESELLWPEILADLSTDNLKPVYKADKVTDLASLKNYPTNLIRPRKYRDVWSVMVSRGCRFKCHYCTVPRFFEQQTYRPIGQVIDEIKSSGQQQFELKADNLTSDREYCLELFEALAPLNIYWTAETNLRFADDEELLTAAGKSGLWYLLVGLETPSKAALKEAAKGFNNIHKSKSYIEKLHEHNIVVDSCMIFGFDEHDSHIFQDTWDYIHDVELDVCHPTIMIPFPGTPLYNEMEQQKRVLSRDWSKYDGDHAVYQPLGMTVDGLESGCNWFVNRYYSTTESMKRKYRHTKRFGTTIGWDLP